MKKKLYVVRMSYVPNTAELNRFLALTKGYGENDIKTKVIFALPDKEHHKVEVEYENVEFVYLWERTKRKNKYLIFLSSLFKLFFMLEKGIPVIFYGLMNYIFFFRLRKKVKMYHERTEHPEVSGKEHGYLGNLLYKLYLRTCKRLDGLFLISPSLFNYFTKEIGVAESKVHIINMLVDSDRFKNISNNKSSKYISYCGTISEYKDGINILIEAFSKLHIIYPDYILRIIGFFENDNVKNKILTLVNSLNIQNNIEFTGTVHASKMPRMLADSKILVLSRPNNKQSQYGFPTKLGEYLMTGVPVLVTEVGDINRYLTNRESIVFAKPDSVDDFAKKMQWILDNYNDALNIASKGKQKALENFNYLLESRKVLNVIFK